MDRGSEIEAFYRRRLQEAVSAFAGGSKDAFGRLIGYTGGGPVRQVLNEDRPMQQAILDRSAKFPEGHPLRTWFELPSNLRSDADKGMPPGSSTLSAEVLAALSRADHDTVMKVESMARMLLGLPFSSPGQANETAA